MVSGNDAHGEAGPEYWTTLNPCAEPMCEAAENLSHVSSGVLVTVKSMIYSNEEYSVFGNLCKKAAGDNREFSTRERPQRRRSMDQIYVSSSPQKPVGRWR